MCIKIIQININWNYTGYKIVKKLFNNILRAAFHESFVLFFCGLTKLFDGPTVGKRCYRV